MLTILGGACAIAAIAFTGMYVSRQMDARQTKALLAKSPKHNRFTKSDPAASDTPSRRKPGFGNRGLD